MALPLCILAAFVLICLQHSRCKPWLKICFNPVFSIFIEQNVAWHQFVNAFEESLLQRRILKGQILLQRQLVHFPLIAGKGKNALNLGCKYKVFPNLGIIHRLNPKEVPGKHQSLLFFIPHRKSKHSPQLVQGFFPVLLKGIDQNLRVGMGAKCNPSRL